MKRFLKKGWPWILGACVLAGVLVLLLIKPKTDPAPAVPTLTVETPQKLSATKTEEFTLDVKVNDLGPARYPAMSMCIAFDDARLEFLGVEEGNIFVSGGSGGRQLPQWSCNVQSSNETGQINIMYLDMTGGTQAFCRELLAENDNVLLRLKFRLRGSVRPGDVLELTVEDAVFAASDQTQSLAMTSNTLNIQNGRLVIGE